MVALKELNPVGVTITDEIVRCNESVTINGSTYFKGYLNNVANENIYGSDSLSFGAYSAASKGGTRYFVLIAGYPVNNTQISIDCKNGWVFSKTSSTYYVTYLAHEPVKHNINNILIDVPCVLTAGKSMTIEQVKFPWFSKFGYALVDIQGGNPSVDCNLVLSNGTESVNIPLYASQSTYVVEFASVLKVTSTETLTISTTDGKGCFDLSIYLMDV